MSTFFWFLGSSVLVLSLYLWILWVKWRAFPYLDYDSDETFPMINIVRQWMHVPTLKLRAGEMTAQEVRTVLAVLGAICAEMELKADPDLCEDEGCPHSDIPHGHNPVAAAEGYVHFQTDFYDVAKDSFPSITPAAAAETPKCWACNDTKKVITSSNGSGLIEEECACTYPAAAAAEPSPVVQGEPVAPSARALAIADQFVSHPDVVRDLATLIMNFATPAAESKK